MSWLTRSIVRTSEPKPARPAFLGWLAAILTIQLTLYFLVSVVTAVDREWGALGVILGAALFPVTLVVMPVYAGLAHGQWVLVGLLAASIVLLSLFSLSEGSAARYSGYRVRRGDAADISSQRRNS
jgi:hypothetical protein